MANESRPARQATTRQNTQPATRMPTAMNNDLVSRFTVLIERVASVLAAWLPGVPPAARTAGIGQMLSRRA
jgi:hypothetical protein